MRTLNAEAGVYHFYHTAGGITQVIPCYIENITLPNRGFGQFQKFNIDVIGSGFYWEDLEEKVRTLSYASGGWLFPFKFPVRFSKRGSERYIVNEGDTTAPIRIEFIGRAINPSVINETTGEVIPWIES